LIRRYKKIRSFFSNRIDLVNPISVNRITEKTKRFSLVVMVSEKNVVDKSLKVEDLTGWTTVYVDDNFFDSIVMDEIIGAVCERRDDQIKVTNVLWPDTPLRREISILDEDLCCLFLSDLLLNQNLEQKTETILKRLKGMKYEQLFIFLFGEPFDKERIEKFLSKMPTNSKVFLVQDQTNFEDVDGISCLISPAFLRIGRKINLLLCSGKQFSSYKRIWPNKAPEEIMLNLLRKRHLDPVFDLGKVSDEDRLTIDPVPDIFVSGSFGPPGITNYKGTTIISCGSFPSEPIYWIVNLRTRENIKISLA
jgi:DNA polymerase II small subunit/DNA polymerase delta subunit B